MPVPYPGKVPNGTGSRIDGDEAQTGQREFITLCNRAGVEPPHSGRHTANIMSAGNNYEPCHFVTLWASRGIYNFSIAGAFGTVVSCIPF